MRAEKQYISKEYVERLNQSPYFIVVDYQGLTVVHFGELRKRLRQVEAEVHVVKNSIFRIAAKEAGVGELNGAMAGQLAVVTGQKEITAAAKVVKNFQAEFDKLKMKFGFMDNRRLGGEELAVLADLPSLEVLRSQLMAAVQGPMTKLVRVLNTPGAQLARVIQAKADKG